MGEGLRTESDADIVLCSWLLAVGLGGLGWTVPAAACTYAPVTAQVAAERVPLQGPIMVDLSCVGEGSQFCESAEPELTVFADGAPVDGQVKLVRGDDRLFVAFLPDAPLQDEGIYAIGLQHEQLHGEYDLWVTADSGREPGVGDLSQLKGVLRPSTGGVGEAHCCAGGFFCFDTCFTERQTHQATLKTSFQGQAEADAVYRMLWTESDGSEKATGWRRPDETLEAHFTEPAERYCATVEARVLGSGRLTQTELCSDATAELQVGQVLEPSYDWEDFGVQCAVPPGMDPGCDPATEDCAVPSPALRDAWCASARAQCALDPDEPDPCEKAARHCGETSTPPDPGAPSGQSPSVGDAGCSAAGPVGSHLAPWWSLLASFWISRRRDRGHP